MKVGKILKERYPNIAEALAERDTPQGAVEALEEEAKLRSGRLKAEKPETLDFTDLPSNVQDVLEAEDVKTAGDVKDLGYEGLCALKGIGDARARKIGQIAGLIEPEPQRGDVLQPSRQYGKDGYAVRGGGYFRISKKAQPETAPCRWTSKHPNEWAADGFYVRAYSDDGELLGFLKPR